MAAEKSAREQRVRGRPFRKGQSGNPAGKPRGTRNRSTILLESISESDLQAVVAATVEKAKAGDLAATKLILDRVIPAPKSRVVPVELPAIGQWDGTATVLHAYRMVVQAVGAGQISPAEGLELISLIEAQRVAVNELRPQAMHRQPTPEELAEQKRQNEEWHKRFRPLMP